MGPIPPGLWTGLSVVLVVLVHEAGHYIAAGRAGIPGSHRRLRLLTIPPHVSLRLEEEWVNPFATRRYARAYRQFDRANAYGWWFTAGGMLAQWLVLLPIGLFVGRVGLPIGKHLVTVSLAFVLGYIAIDGAVTWWRGVAFGDVAHLWRLDPRGTVLTLLGFISSHLVGLAVLG